jgi:hypothetical protein
MTFLSRLGAKSPSPPNDDTPAAPTGVVTTRRLRLTDGVLAVIHIENTLHYSARPVLSSAPPRRRRTEAPGAGRTRQRRPRHLRPTLRHSFLTAILAAPITPMIPVMSATELSAVSLKLAGLIAEFERHTAELGATPEITFARDEVSDSRLRVLKELLDYRPAGLGELATKLKVLKSFVSEDEDLVSVDVILDDIHALIGEDE